MSTCLQCGKEEIKLKRKRFVMVSVIFSSQSSLQSLPSLQFNREGSCGKAVFPKYSIDPGAITRVTHGSKKQCACYCVLGESSPSYCLALVVYDLFLPAAPTFC